MIDYRQVMKFEKKDVEKFLEGFDIKYERDVDYTIVALDGDKVVGTGSCAGRILKCFAIDPTYQGMGITNTIITRLLDHQYQVGNKHLFIFTKPKSIKIFTDFGFSIVEKTEDVALLDNKIEELNQLLKNIEDQRESGAIVVNANPMTKGHLYLINEARKMTDLLHVFMVEEDESTFPYDFRYKIVKEELEKFDDVLVHPGNNYIISKNTFPTYFYKDEKTILKAYSELDSKIFGRYFARTLNIKKRFVGTEDKDLVTKNYNETMERILPDYGIEVVEIPRASLDDEIISASKVRLFLKERKFEEAYKFLPEATIKALKSEEGQRIINERL
ncbi:MULTISPECIES: [citrate (pro-3S)-lyase] ligase [Peptoniphilus]|uniref:[citrate (pro-3S)-lyase] ligase n=1 Tax=Peptoniphilus TaxID=162289 RepID=UPI0009F1725E|nr:MULTISPECIES: [citrate (pro-3S)-lyase] ligase [Peptoniphilus]MDU3750576.1 [citrate (pro-3S)-lyase] ligase [Peptoniphilus rhinitidis]MDU5378094.1 [citrate (pro-3S)-lyase] ligase [Peptoniphilus lacydonensis]MDU5437252.1 [citrate (pro-3S)-lyase] ligase [Peptoniphilus lacydonensis]MDU5594483.1 [citrate (pro-3S)-lyase] ligase [Peptoniphilus rhinitidis]MDU7302501.1 [citrate (pro-3S)-lyase] ligase [Peptoniphilus lacydonensis]